MNVHKAIRKVHRAMKLGLIGVEECKLHILSLLLMERKTRRINRRNAAIVAKQRVIEYGY